MKIQVNKNWEDVPIQKNKFIILLQLNCSKMFLQVIIKPPN